MANGQCGSAFARRFGAATLTYRSSTGLKSSKQLRRVSHDCIPILVLEAHRNAHPRLWQIADPFGLARAASLPARLGVGRESVLTIATLLNDKSAKSKAAKVGSLSSRIYCPPSVFLTPLPIVVAETDVIV